MEKKPAELPVSPQVRQPADQIQSPSFMDKLKIHKGKILVGIFWVLIFVGAVFGAYKLGQRQLYPEPVEGPTPTLIATPTPGPTADWETYTNEKYGYSIKLPPNWGEWSIKTGEWKFSQIISRSAEHILFGVDEQVVTTDEGIIIPPQKIEISVHLNETKVGWLTTLQKPEGECSEEPIIIGEAIPAYKILCPGFYSVIYLVEKNNNLYRITKGKEFAEFDLILSTFKFLEEENPVPSPANIEKITYKPISTWQTYNDSQAKFSVQYPESYKLSSSTPGKEVIFWSCFNNPQNKEICLSGYMIRIYENYDGGSRRAWFEKLRPNFLIDPYYEDVYVFGIKALIIMDGNTGGSTGSFVLIPKGNRMFLFDFPGGWNPETKEKPELDFIKQVLSTFKFLD